MPVGGQRVRSLSDFTQCLDEFLPVRRGQGFQQPPLGPVGGVAGAAQRLAARRADRHRIGALIFLGALAGEQALLQHPAHHLRQGGTIDAGDLHQRGLTGAVILLQRREQGELRLGQFTLARLARIKVAIELLAATNEVRWGFGKVKPALRLPRPLHHASPCSPAQNLSSVS